MPPKFEFKLLYSLLQGQFVVDNEQARSHDTDESIDNPIVGTHIIKSFDDKLYKGVVVSSSVELDTGKEIYKIVYEDNDFEDMYAEEVAFWESVMIMYTLKNRC